MGRLPLWPAGQEGALAGLPRPGKKRPPRPDTQLSLAPLEERWVPQDLLSLIRSGTSAVGISVIGEMVLGHDVNQTPTPAVPRPTAGSTTAKPDGSADDLAQRESLAFLSVPTAAQQHVAENAIAMPAPVQSEPVQSASAVGGMADWLQQVGNFLGSQSPPLQTPTPGEPSTNSGGSDGPGSPGAGLNTSQPGAPMPATPSNVSSANAAAPIAQAAAMSNTAGAMGPMLLPAAAPVSGTSGTGTGSKGGGTPLSPDGGGGSGGGSSGSGSGSGSGGSSQGGGPGSAALAGSFGQIPLPFELNQGQTDPSVVALSNGPGFGLWLKNDGSMTFRLPKDSAGGTQVFTLQPVGAATQPAIVPGTQLISRSNYFIGAQNGSGWISDVAQYSSLTDQNVYPNIDLVLHSRAVSDRTFEFDYVLHAGADMTKIHLNLQGVQGAQLDGQGRLLLLTPGGSVVMNTPVLYQTINGQKQYVNGQYVLNPDHSVGFQATGRYDNAHDLVIDPALSYSSYVGGSGNDVAYGVAVDNLGSIYLAGSTTSTNLPANGYSTGLTGTQDAFVAKLTPDGSNLVYLSYLGGTSAQAAHGIAVNAAGEVAIAGVTSSSDFPTTAGAYSTSYPGGSYSGFVARFNGTGDFLEWASYLGSSDSADGVAMDALGAVYVTGVVNGVGSIPTTSGAYQTSYGGGATDAFVSKFDAGGDSLVYSTYLGGSSSEGLTEGPSDGPAGQGGIVVDGAGDAFVTGQTSSSNFPLTAGSYSGGLGTAAAYVTEINPAGSALVYSYVIGPSGTTKGHAIALDNSGQAFITGETNSTSFPVTSGAAQSTLGGGTDAFVLGVNSAGNTLVYATYLGGSGSDAGYGIGVDGQDQVSVTGTTSSSNFPTTSNGFQTTMHGASAAFITQLTPTGTLSYSSFLGSTSSSDFLSVTKGMGLAVDVHGEAYLGGMTNATALVLNNSYQGSNAGGYDAIVSKIILNRPAPPAITAISPDTGSSSSDFITTSQNLTISGTATPSTTVTLERADAGVLGSVPVSTGGTWAYDYSGTTLPEGTYDFAATDTDGSGATSDLSRYQKVTVDRTAPSLTATVLDNGAPSAINTLSPTVQVTASDLGGIPANATVTLDVDLNNDGNYTDSGETGYATGNLVNGQAIITLPQLPSTGTYTFQARVTDKAGNQGTSLQMPFFINNNTSWAGTAYVLDADPTEGLWQPQLGDVSLSHPLDLDQSPGTSQGGDPALVYHSNQISHKPIVAVNLKTPNTLNLPSFITATLTFNGVAGTGVNFNTSNLAPGRIITIALQASNAVTLTGRYPYSVAVTAGSFSGTFTGSSYFVAEGGDALGDGWSLAGVDQLWSIGASFGQPAGMLRVFGSGGFRFYASNGLGGYNSPLGDNGTLSVSGGTYTYSTPDGQSWTFNSSLNMTQWQSADTQEKLQYRYDGSSRLTGITAIDGALTTITYTGATTVTFQTVNNRLTTLTLDSNVNLTSIVNPDGGVQTLTYDTNHHLTSEQLGLMAEGWSYNSAGEMGTYTWGRPPQVSGGGTSPSQFSFQPANMQGLWLGGIGTPATDPFFGSLTDANGFTTSYQMDNDARPLKVIAADGGTTLYLYNSNAFLTQVTEPLGRTTSYALDSSEYVTRETLPEGGVITYQYQSAFHALTTMIDERNHTTTYAYDGSGHLVRMVDALGDITTYSWSSSGLLTGTIDALNNRSTYSYDSDRRLTMVTDALNNKTSYAYDANGNLNRVTDALGRVTSMTNDVMGRPLVTFDALNNRTTMTWDISGLELTRTDPLTMVYSYGYDPYMRGLLTSEQESKGGQSITTLSSYDNNGNLSMVRDPNGWTTSYTYDPVGRLSTTTDGVGNTTTNLYDQAGRKVFVYDGMGYLTAYLYTPQDWVDQVTNAAGITTINYDLAGNATAVTDPLNHTYTYTYDALNRETVVQDPLNHLVTTSYDAVGNVGTMVDAKRNTTVYSYDPLNRLTATTEAAATSVQRTTRQYLDAVGNVTMTSDGRGYLTSYTHDALDRVTAITDPLLHTTTLAYDAVGDLTTSQDALGKVVTYSYDGLHRLTQTTDPLTHATTLTLDADGNVVQVTDALLHTTTYGYDQDGVNTQVIDGNQHLTQAILDCDEQVHVLVDASGNRTTFVMDQLERVTKTITPMGTSTVAYDAASRVTQKTDANGNVIQYNYDNADRLTGEVWKNASLGLATVNVVTYAYDNNDNLTSGADQTGTVTYTYDPLNRVSSTTNVFGQILTYSYDLNDNVTLRSDSLGGAISKTYDAADRLATLTYTATPSVRVDFGYNNRNDMTTITWYSDLAGTAQIANSAYGYDDAGRLTSIVNKNATSATLSYYTYMYDQADRKTTQSYWSKVGGTTYSGTNTYGYDAANQLTNDNATAYKYDASGNRSMTGYTTTTYNRMTGDGTYTYSYDNVGNVTSKSKGSGLGLELWNYSYDNDNELTGIVKWVGGSRTLQITYSYDVTGHRVQEQIWQTGGTVTTTRFAYDGDNLWADLNGSNSLLDRYIYGDGTNQILARIVNSGPNAGVWAYFTDAQGSVRDLVNASGSVQDHIDYTAYGVPTESNPSVGSIIGYDGYQYEVSTGLDYTWARWYNPSTGTWLTQDPIGFAGGQANLHQYGSNDPLNLTDPTGLVAPPIKEPKGKFGEYKDGDFGVVWAQLPSPTDPLFTVLPHKNEDYVSHDGFSGTREWHEKFKKHQNTFGSKEPLYHDDFEVDKTKPQGNDGALVYGDKGWMLKGRYRITFCTALGHAWVTYTNLDTGEIYTFGRYKSGYTQQTGPDGVHVNDKNDLEKFRKGEYAVTDSFEGTDPSVFGGEGYCLSGNNCVSYMRSVRNEYTWEYSPEQIVAGLRDIPALEAIADGVGRTIFPWRWVLRPLKPGLRK
jgi:RHS repeat-associated protein